MRRLPLSFVLVWILSTGGFVIAAVTGSLQVNVTDPAGESLPGASVAIESPSQLGVRSATTGAGGAARFNALAPGTYEVTVSMPGYGKLVQDGNAVTLDKVTYVAARLTEGLVETVRVTARPPLVDTSSTTIGQDLSRDFADSIPTYRSYQSQFEIVAGVGTGSNPWVHGATGSDNVYLIDGVNTTDPLTGTFATNINYEIIDQHEITTGGHMAEYGGVVGMVSNLVTKSGGNEWSGSVNFYRRDKDWNSDFKEDAVASSQLSAWNASYTLGGPILKDRLWHFTSFQKIRTKTETLVPEGSETRPDRVFDGDQIFAKLTWQVSPSHRLQLQVNEGDADISNVNARNVNLDRDQFSLQRQGTTPSSLKYTALLGKNLVLEGQLNFHRQDLDVVPQYPGAGPNHQTFGTSQQFGRYSTEYVSDRDRDEIRLDLNWFLAAGPGEHNLKLGGQYIETDFRAITINSGGERLFDRPAAGRNLWNIFGPGGGLLFRFEGLDTYNPGWECYLGGVRCADQTASPSSFTNPADWQMVVGGATYDPTDFAFDDPSENADASALGWVRFVRLASSELGNVGRVGQDIAALYAQDDWRFKKLTVRAGLRIERQELRNSHGENYFDFDTTVAPRLGITYDPGGDGRQKIYAHYGRLYDPLRDNTAGFTGQLGQPLSETQFWFAPLGGYFTWAASGGPGDPGATVSPVVETPYTDEYLLGWARQFGEDVSLEITGIRRRTEDITEDLDPVLGLGDPAIYPELQSGPTLQSLGFGDRNGDGVVDADDIDTRFVVYNPPGATREFDGVDVVFRKRFSNRWRLLASYSWADFEGNVIGDGLYGIIGDDPYWDPRLRHNYGPINGRDHTYKAYGSYRFPFGLQIGASIQVLSGAHYGMSGIVTPDQSTGYWDGDPAKLVDTLSIDRSVFATALGIPETLPGGGANPQLDEAIIALIPFELKAGRGAYEQPWYTELSLRFRYDFRAWKKLNGELFFDVLNVLNDQDVVARSGRMGTQAGASVDPSNIGNRSIYTFQETISTESPRSYFAGVRFSF
jgi:hypothetical protein